ncbi:type I restriction enzyme HsdR N-terminal domain-containing protein [Crocinitomicaceae bacterium]|nr:type I restriction enzyme HsdR N-terminal domain-containing protein [Crocinitomicaceae bacterium]MDB3906478.1 type I restriction enzyme HsdR N-terminal domain-containing protein [Crocinitomicaceae bacterium]
MNGTVYVDCLIRQKKLVLTPEEWVRQHVLHYLIEMGVPKGLIASEVSLKYNERTKRADIVIYGRDQKPKFIVECKAADVQLSEAVFRQIASYNHTLQVEYLMMTNGMRHIYAHVDLKSGKLNYLEEFPEDLKL